MSVLKNILIGTGVAVVTAGAGFVGGTIYKDKTIDVTQSSEYKEVSDENNALTTELNATRIKLSNAMIDKQKLQLTLDEKNEQLTTLAERLATCESNITTLQSNKADIEAQIRTLESGAGDTTETIEALTNQLTEVENNLANEINAREELASQIESTTTSVNNLNIQIEGIHTRISTLSAQVANLQNQLSGYAKIVGNYIYTNEYKTLNELDCTLHPELEGLGTSSIQMGVYPTELTIKCEAFRVQQGFSELNNMYGFKQNSDYTAYEYACGIDNFANKDTDGYYVFEGDLLIKYTSFGGSSGGVMEVYNYSGLYIRFVYVQLDELTGSNYIQFKGNITYSYIATPDRHTTTTDNNGSINNNGAIVNPGEINGSISNSEA